MKKFVFVLACVLVANMFLTACTMHKTQTINYNRRLQKYLPAETSKQRPTGVTVDLSEGPRLKYEGNLGPNDLNFDIKIKNPY